MNHGWCLGRKKKKKTWTRRCAVNGWDVMWSTDTRVSEVYLGSYSERGKEKHDS